MFLHPAETASVRVDETDGTFLALSPSEMMQSPPIVPHALIADDQVEVLEALRLLLKGEGILAHGVTSPQGVLEALRSRHFDILLMDLNYARDTTSGHEGLDLLDRIQVLDATLLVISQD